MARKDSYTPDEIEACIIVMRELFTYLKPYREQIVLVGGWVPFFLLEKYHRNDYIPHTGSLDIDIALDASSIPGTAYQTILDILEDKGFCNRKDRLGNDIPASFLKKVVLENGKEIEVQIDFLAPQYGGTTKGKRHQLIQDMLARKGRGIDLVFGHTESIRMSGKLSNKAQVDLEIKVANIVACFVMKGIALGERTSEKDAYDLYMIARYYKYGPESILSELKALRNHGLMKEAVKNIGEQFKEINSIGPVSVAEFMGITDEEEYNRITRDAFEVLQFIIRGLKA
jgi:hypothetical protein